MDIRKFQESDRTEVIALWEQCELVRPQNHPDSDIDLKMSFQPDLFFVGVENELIVATVMAGYQGHRGWINYLAVDPNIQRSGNGEAMMDYAEDALKKLGCVKINLQVRSTNSAVLGFYDSIGYVKDEVTSLGKRLS
ncbi:MAG: GNAT family acetyltransferase [Chloroflexi bacterium]|jgi:ribosomal protein S18 acetylase RimI-like enzyme|nr:GNAT family acetyltransferase [Chloroflexota bacterium]MDA1283271.1 GNAT family acetyltransferase [Chloroflexota bacterium]